MKKLMIAAAIVCAAALSQAATFSWSITEVPAAGTTAAAKDWAVYFLAADKYDAAVKAGAAGIAAYAVDNALYTSATTESRGKVSANGSGFGNYTTDQTQSGFVVIFDNATAANADYFAMTAVRTSDAVSAVGNNIKIDYGTFATATTGWNEISNVPEPTSGLLLLIGVAGLALRRRRA